MLNIINQYKDSQSFRENQIVHSQSGVSQFAITRDPAECPSPNKRSRTPEYPQNPFLTNIIRQYNSNHEKPPFSETRNPKSTIRRKSVYNTSIPHFMFGRSNRKTNLTTAIGARFRVKRHVTCQKSEKVKL